MPPYNEIVIQAYIDLINQIRQGILYCNHILNINYFQVNERVYYDAGGVDLVHLPKNTLLDFYLHRWGKMIKCRLHASIRSNINIFGELCPPELWYQIIVPHLASCGAVQQPTVGRSGEIWTISTLQIARKVWDKHRLSNNYLKKKFTNKDTAQLFVTDEYPMIIKMKQGLVSVQASWEIINEFGIPICSVALI